MATVRALMQQMIARGWKPGGLAAPERIAVLEREFIPPSGPSESGFHCSGDRMKESNSWEVKWNGQTVGFVENPDIDMFHNPGRWVPCNTEHSSRFLEAFKGGQEILVDFGACGSFSKGSVESIEAGEIEILSRVSRGDERSD